MKRLIAKRPILYLGRMYQEGEALPGGDAKMVDAWVRNKSAEWSGENDKTAQDGTQGTQDGQDGAKGTQGTQDGTQGTQDGGMIAGHLDPKDLESLKKADLERMATDMGMEISEAKTKADLIAVITAAEVYAPAENENGGAQ